MQSQIAIQINLKPINFDFFFLYKKNKFSIILTLFTLKNIKHHTIVIIRIILIHFNAFSVFITKILNKTGG